MIERFGSQFAVGAALVLALNGCTAASGSDCRVSGPLGDLRDQGLEVVDNIPQWPVDGGVIARVDTAQRRAAEIPDANVSAETSTVVTGALGRLVLVAADSLQADVADPDINRQTIDALEQVVGRMPNEASSAIPNSLPPRFLADQALQVSIADAAVGEPGVPSNPQAVDGLIAEIRDYDMQLQVLAANGDNTSDASAARSRLNARKRQLTSQVNALADTSRQNLFDGSGQQAEAINRACAAFDRAVETKGR